MIRKVVTGDYSCQQPPAAMWDWRRRRRGEKRWDDSIRLESVSLTHIQREREREERMHLLLSSSHQKSRDDREISIVADSRCDDGGGGTCL